MDETSGGQASFAVLVRCAVINAGEFIQTDWWPPDEPGQQIRNRMV